MDPWKFIPLLNENKGFGEEGIEKQKDLQLALDGLEQNVIWKKDPQVKLTVERKKKKWKKKRGILSKQKAEKKSLKTILLDE